MRPQVHVRIDELHFAGYECVRLRTDDLEVIATHSAGPRIIALRRPDGANVLAQLPDAIIDRSAGPPFRFIGGHRLWAAPEIPAVTYAPDDASVDVSINGSSVTLHAPPDEAGLQKTLDVTLASELTVEHTIINRGESRTIAPWAITQLVPGGTAVMPLGSRNPDEYQADSSVVAWPYSDWDDPLVAIGNGRIQIEAKRIDPIKFGTALRREWLAYKLDEHLFVKRTPRTPGPHPDLGATGQCYAIRSFIELETLGRLATVSTDDSVTHLETWELHTVDPATPAGEIVDGLDLDEAGP